MKKEPDTGKSGDRIAKIMARSGLCSRREAEQWIADGRVSVNGRVLTTPAVVITPADKVSVDGQPLPTRERTRLWTFHKPRGLVTTTHDPEGRPTVFDNLPTDLPRVITIGRLDINTEGLLLFTNDGGLARVLELPTTGWMRRYRVRAHGAITQEKLDTLGEGFAVEGVLYGPIEAKLDRQQGQNVWLTLGLREGKNREVKRVLEALGLTVNRLIRISYGPFQLGDTKPGEVNEIRGRVLRDQLGQRLTEESGADFSTPVLPRVPAPRTPAQKTRPPKPAKAGAGGRPRDDDPDASRRPGRNRKASGGGGHFVDKPRGRGGKPAVSGGQDKPRGGQPSGGGRPSGRGGGASGSGNPSGKGRPGGRKRP